MTEKKHWTAIDDQRYIRRPILSSTREFYRSPIKKKIDGKSESLTQKIMDIEERRKRAVIAVEELRFQMEPQEKQKLVDAVIEHSVDEPV